MEKIQKNQGKMLEIKNMDGTRDSHTKSERERQIPDDITYIWNLICSTNEPFHRKEANLWTWRIDMWLPRRKGREGAWHPW